MTGLGLSPVGIIAIVLLAAAVILSAARLIRGPSVPDRVIAADILSVITTAGLVLLAALQKSPLILDVALVFGVLSFVGVVAIARALQK